MTNLFITLTILALVIITLGFVTYRTIKTNGDLYGEIHDLRSKIARYQDRRSLLAFAYVSETLLYARVVLCDCGQEYEVRAFPKGDDPEYAMLCATELADAINADF